MYTLTLWLSNCKIKREGVYTTPYKLEVLGARRHTPSIANKEAL